MTTANDAMQQPPQASPSYCPTDHSYTELKQLHSLFDPVRLRRDTQLMDVPGVHLREGSKLLLTTAPGGNILLQGMCQHANQAEITKMSGTPDCLLMLSFQY